MYYYYRHRYYYDINISKIRKSLSIGLRVHHITFKLTEVAQIHLTVVSKIHKSPRICLRVHNIT